MTGYLSSFTQTAGKAKFTRGPQISAFVQDTWRVIPRLSLDFGLRWEPFIPYTDPVENQVGGFIPGFKSQGSRRRQWGLPSLGILVFRPAASMRTPTTLLPD